MPRTFIPLQLAVEIPKRQTVGSAGYDFYLMRDEVIRPNSELLINTGIAALMNSDEYLMIVPRSSIGKKGLSLANTIAIIDSDYHDEILLILKNNTSDTIILKKNERIVQGIFMKYYLDEYEERVTKTRYSGIGSTSA